MSSRCALVSWRPAKEQGMAETAERSRCLAKRDRLWCCYPTAVVKETLVIGFTKISVCLAYVHFCIPLVFFLSYQVMG